MKRRPRVALHQASAVNKITLGLLASLPAFGVALQPPAQGPAPASPAAPPATASRQTEPITVKFSYLLASARAALAPRAFSERAAITLRDASAKPSTPKDSPHAALLDRAAIVATSSLTLHYQPPQPQVGDAAPLPAKLRIEAGRINAWATTQSLTILADDIPAAATKALWPEPQPSPQQTLFAQDQLPSLPLPQLAILFDDESAWLTQPVPAAGKLTWPSEISLTLDRPDAPIIVQGSGPHGPATAEFDQRTARLTRLAVSLPQHRTLEVQIGQVAHQPEALIAPDLKDRQLLPTFRALVAFKPEPKPEPNPQPTDGLPAAPNAVPPASSPQPSTINPPANADAPSRTQP